MTKDKKQCCTGSCVQCCTMTLLSRTASGAILCVLIDATLRWRDDGGESVGLASAFQLSSPPDYCSKDMSFTEVPCLAKSINQTFNGSVTIADVEMLQVNGRPLVLASLCCWRFTLSLWGWPCRGRNLLFVQNYRRDHTSM